MSETLVANEQLRELLHPRTTPEMGFQSYEALKGDAGYRKEQKTAFIQGDIVVPVLDYPALDRRELEQGIAALNRVLDQAQRHPDKHIGDAIWDSASYRMAELYWLQASEDLTRTHARRDPAELDQLAGMVQDLNEQLYGRPEAAITDPLHAEVWAQIDAKHLVGNAAQIKRELEYGVKLHIADQPVALAVLKRPESERLPQIPGELLAALKEKLYSDNADIIELVYDYYENVIMQRPPDERVFTPDDMLKVFEEVHALRDPYNKSGVSIIKDPAATALSWDSSVMAVKVGGQRPPISDPQDMLAKVLHEYVVHGGRSIFGAQAALPVLGTGLFTNADPGEQSDYLTFEEGFATMCEMAVLSDNQYEWPINYLERTLGDALIYEGNDFRQVYETLWRVRALMGAEDGQELSAKAIKAAKSNAYNSTLRLFRGTPTDMPRTTEQGEPRILSYNKDLAYLKGKLQVIEYWEQYGNDPEMLDLLFKAKFDPLNRRQLAIARQYAA